MQIKPILKSKRNTVILHDLPEAIAEEELRHKLLIDGSTGITGQCRHPHQFASSAIDRLM